jgi:hypothetical protein
MSITGRRARYAALSGVLILAATASAIIAGVLGERFALRLDVTATQQHRLSPRAMATLAALPGPTRIVLAGPLRDGRAVDRQALGRLTDVLDELRRRSTERAPVSITLMDTTSAAGLGQYDQLLAEMVERERPRTAAYAAAIANAARGCEQLAEAFEGLAGSLGAIRDAIPAGSSAEESNRRYFDLRAEECRSSAAILRRLAETTRAGLDQPMPQSPLPEYERAAADLRATLGTVQDGLGDIAGNTARIVPILEAPRQEAARAAAQAAARGRDQAAIMRDALDRLPPLDLPRIARSLQGGSGALVIGPPGTTVTGVEFARLLPAPEERTSGRADTGQRAEELFTTALAAIVSPIRPIVVILHAQTPGFFRNARLFELITQRLQLRGIDVLTWDAADPQPTGLSRLDPRGERPVVFVVFNTASHGGGQGGQTGLERAQKLGKAVEGLIASGKPVLMSLFPSTLPSLGQPDPTTAALTALGIRTDTGRVILREVQSPAAGRLVQPVQLLVALESANPISGAVRGLRTRFDWPVAMSLDEGSPLAATPLYRVEGPDAWAESQWLGFLQVWSERNPAVPNAPSNDSPRDDPTGPWTVALAAERRVPGLDRPQRLVIVGSNFWFTDQVLGAATEIDGRTVDVNPGNGELFEACTYWLADQDGLIAQSAIARAMPAIGPVNAQALLAIRWGAIAGLPLAVLLLGLAWRALRG